MIQIKAAYTCKVGDFSFYDRHAQNGPDGNTFDTDTDCLILYQDCYYLSYTAYKNFHDKIKTYHAKLAEEKANKFSFGFTDEATRDQVAAVLLLKGTTKQQIEALEYAGSHSLAEIVKERENLLAKVRIEKDKVYPADYLLGKIFEQLTRIGPDVDISITEAKGGLVITLEKPQTTS